MEARRPDWRLRCPPRPAVTPHTRSSSSQRLWRVGAETRADEWAGPEGHAGARVALDGPGRCQRSGRSLTAVLERTPTKVIVSADSGIAAAQRAPLSAFGRRPPVGGTRECRKPLAVLRQCRHRPVALPVPSRRRKKIVIGLKVEYSHVSVVTLRRPGISLPWRRN
jgi:hypothetical protein